MQASAERCAATPGTPRIRWCAGIVTATVVRRAVRRARTADRATGGALGAERRATLAQTCGNASVRTLAVGAARELGRSTLMHTDAYVADATARADVGRMCHRNRQEHHRE